MSTLNTISKKSYVQYEYIDDKIMTSGSYVKDDIADKIQTISGSCNLISDNTFIGSFSGRLEGTEMVYAINSILPEYKLIIDNIAKEIVAKL